jgi:glycosyltransferase involved in cell wall biosynthesis
MALAILARTPRAKRFLGMLKFYLQTRNRRIHILSIAPTINFSADLTSLKRQKRLYYDISALCLNNDERGIHRVVKNVLNQLLNGDADGFQVVTVRSTINGIVTCKLGGYEDRSQKHGFEGDLVHAEPGDIFISLDLYRKFNFRALQELKKSGLKVYFIVYDLLDIRTCCLGEKDLITRMIARIARISYRNWLFNVLMLSDGVVCDSRAIVTELLGYLSKNANTYQRSIPLGFFHLGADFSPSNNANHGLTLDDSSFICGLEKKPSFLMVGVMDPHKGHTQVIRAFEKLWQETIDVNLIIIGKVGLLQPHLGELIRGHAEFGHRLFWIEYVTDEILSSLYNNCTALLAASFCEGFGLPLIEAAHHGLPIIARDIPVFREVAGTNAHYFKNSDSDSIADGIKSWLLLADKNKTPQSADMRYLNWAASTRELLDVVVHNKWCVCWAGGSIAHGKLINDVASDDQASSDL